MNINYEYGQVILRALRDHARRMLEIAKCESQLQRNDTAESAVHESKLAERFVERIERGGAADASYEDAQLMMRALHGYIKRRMDAADGARLKADLLMVELAIRDEIAKSNTLVKLLESEGVRIT